MYAEIIIIFLVIVIIIGGYEIFKPGPISTPSSAPTVCILPDGTQSSTNCPSGVATAATWTPW